MSRGRRWVRRLAVVLLGLALSGAAASTSPVMATRPASGVVRAVINRVGPVTSSAAEMGAVLRRTPGRRLQTEITAIDGTSGDFFGTSVALSMGSALVGAPGKSRYTGAAYIFVRNGATWTEQAELTAADGAPDTFFGTSVALDGNTAVVGAWGANGNVGAAYVFVRSGTTWSQQAKLTAADGAPNDFFGTSVALNGNTALIGADGKSNLAGAAYVFVRSGTGWTQQAKLTASDSAPSDGFGRSVALRGSTALVGAYEKSDSTGAAYLFERSSATWTQQAKLIASDGVPHDFFGTSLTLGKGTVLVGAPGNNSATGAVYTFTHNGTAWTQETELTASGGGSGDFFGSAVALSGSAALVGAYLKTSAIGVAYVFVHNDTTWTQKATLTASGGAPNDGFGASVAISGTTALIGAPYENNNIGAAYAFARN